MPETGGLAASPSSPIPVHKDCGPVRGLGYKAGYMRLIKDTDGSNHDYGTGYSWTDDIYSHADLSFGLTFFLPKGARGAETHKASYDDLLDSGLGAK